MSLINQSMLVNRIKKITGIIRLRILIYDTDTQEHFVPEYVYSGGICLEHSFQMTTISKIPLPLGFQPIKGNKFVSTNYIPGVIDAEFYTYKELEFEFGLISFEQFEQIEQINWSKAHKLQVHSMSKQWDYINFSLDTNVDSCKLDLISFPKINKIAGTYSADKRYSLYGSVNNIFDISGSTKINLIHDSLLPQIFYLGEKTESYSGSLVYTVCENIGSFNLEILGITSNDYDESSRIIPIKYLEYSDFLINTHTEIWTPSFNDLMQIPIVKNTKYPKFNKNFGSNIKKDDVVIMVNGCNILEMEIYNTIIETKLSLNEWICYTSQINHLILLTLVRKGKILEVSVNSKIFKIELPNPIYMDINNLHITCDEIKFSSDISDLMLQNNIYDIKLIKYINDITYQVDKICL